MATRPISPGASVFAAISREIERQKAEQRQASLDGIDFQNTLLARQRAEQQAKRQEEMDRQDAEDRARRIAAEESAGREATNQRGVRDMAAQVVSQPDFNTNATTRQQLAATYIREGLPLPPFLQGVLEPPAGPKRSVVETTDAQGRPVRRSVSEDDLIAGVPVYREPREPRAQSNRWVIRGGQPMFVTEGAIMPGDRPYEAAGSGDKPTQGQASADAFYSRARDASDVLEDVEGSISHVRAHRLMWELANDQRIPPGYVVLHECDNPRCCEPTHLRLGTHADNVADRVSKGRTACGERNGRSKLTAADVAVIRSRRHISKHQLARDFGVERAVIRGILSGELWKGV